MHDTLQAPLRQKHAAHNSNRSRNQCTSTPGPHMQSRKQWNIHWTSSPDKSENMSSIIVDIQNISEKVGVENVKRVLETFYAMRQPLNIFNDVQVCPLCWKQLSLKTDWAYWTMGSKTYRDARKFKIHIILARPCSCSREAGENSGEH